MLHVTTRTELKLQKTFLATPRLRRQSVAVKAGAAQPLVFARPMVRQGGPEEHVRISNGILQAVHNIARQVYYASTLYPPGVRPSDILDLDTLHVTAAMSRCSYNEWCCNASVQDGEDCCSEPENWFVFIDGSLMVTTTLKPTSQQPELHTTNSPLPPLQFTSTLDPVIASIPITISHSIVPSASPSRSSASSITPATSVGPPTRSSTSSSSAASQKSPQSSLVTPNSTQTLGGTTATPNPPPSMSTIPSNPPSYSTPPPPPNPTKNKIIAGICVPIIILLLISTILCVLHRRRKHQSQSKLRRQHEEKLRSWYTPAVRRGPHELDTGLISRPYLKPELPSSEEVGAIRHVVVVEGLPSAAAEERRAEVDVRYSVREGVAGNRGRKSRQTIMDEWIKNQPRTWI